MAVYRHYLTLLSKLETIRDFARTAARTVLFALNVANVEKRRFQILIEIIEIR
jgi:hypothetical protein